MRGSFVSVANRSLCGMDGGGRVFDRCLAMALLRLALGKSGRHRGGGIGFGGCDGASGTMPVQLDVAESGDGDHF